MYGLSFENSILQSRLCEAPEVFIKIPRLGFHPARMVFNFNYSAERERGLDYIEISILQENF
jgi:hypothetical protein